jgi:radical SAM protein with 4Fe4S-binding SPASM domain
MPEFRCQDVTGRVWTSSELAGSEGVVVLFLSATCPYALAQEDRILDLARRFLPRGFGFVAVCSNSDASLAPGNTNEDIRRHAEERGYPFPYLYDADQSLATAFGAVCTPDIFVFGQDQRLAYHGRLDDSWRDAALVSQSYLEEALTCMLAGKEPSDEPVPAFGCAIKWAPPPSLPLPEQLVTSEHLRVLTHVDGPRIVNVLSGTMLEAGPDMVEFLRAFQKPTTLGEVARRLPLPADAAEVAKQLVEIGFLVPPGRDVLAPIRERIATRQERIRSGSLVSILRLNMATGCNLRCTYCYMEAPMVNRQKAEHSASMRQDVARRTIDAFVRNAAANGRQRVSVRYIGGEPLLNAKVLRFSMEYVEQLCHASGIAVTHLLCTNGLLLDRPFAQFLKTLDDAHVLISLDGIREKNDAMRVDRSGHGTYDRVTATIRMLVEEDVPLGVPAVIDAEGLGTTREFLDQLYELGVRRVGLNPAYRFGAIEPSRAELESLVDGFCDARAHAQMLGLELSGKAFMPEWHALHGHVANCEAMGRALVVDPDGSVSLCDKLSETVGHVDALPNVFRTETYERFAMRVRGNIDSCADCEARWLCNGGCLAEARASNGTDYLSGSHCDFIRIMASRILVPLDASRACLARTSSASGIRGQERRWTWNSKRRVTRLWT